MHANVRVTRNGSVLIGGQRPAFAPSSAGLSSSIARSHTVPHRQPFATAATTTTTRIATTTPARGQSVAWRIVRELTYRGLSAATLFPSRAQACADQAVELWVRRHALVYTLEQHGVFLSAADQADLFSSLDPLQRDRVVIAELDALGADQRAGVASSASSASLQPQPRQQPPLPVGSPPPSGPDVHIDRTGNILITPSAKPASTVQQPQSTPQPQQTPTPQPQSPNPRESNGKGASFFIIFFMTEFFTNSLLL